MTRPRRRPIGPSGAPSASSRLEQPLALALRDDAGEVEFVRGERLRSTADRRAASGGDSRDAACAARSWSRAAAGRASDALTPSASISAVAEHHVAAALAVDQRAALGGRAACRRGTSPRRRCGRHGAPDSRRAGRPRRRPRPALRRRAARRRKSPRPGRASPAADADRRRRRRRRGRPRCAGRGARAIPSPPCGRGSPKGRVRGAALSGRSPRRALHPARSQPPPRKGEGSAPVGDADDAVEVAALRHQLARPRDLLREVGVLLRLHQAEMPRRQRYRRIAPHQAEQRHGGAAKALADEIGVALRGDLVDDRAGDAKSPPPAARSPPRWPRRVCARPCAPTTSTTGRPISAASDAVEPAPPGPPS